MAFVLFSSVSTTIFKLKTGKGNVQHVPLPTCYLCLNLAYAYVPANGTINTIAIPIANAPQYWLMIEKIPGTPPTPTELASTP